MSSPGWLVVLVERNNTIYKIASAKDALDLLFSDWPKNTGLPFIQALEACGGVLSGSITNDEAEFAFLAAALDAGVSFEFDEEGIR